MKLIKTASGKQVIKISKSEWETIGQKNGWIKEAREIVKYEDAMLTLKNLEEGREDADSYDSRELYNFLIMKGVRLKDIGTYLEGRAKELQDFIATDGKANKNMLGYLAASLRRFRDEGVI